MLSAFGINIECSWRERKKNGRRSAHHSVSERNEMAIVTNMQNWLSANLSECHIQTPSEWKRSVFIYYYEFNSTWLSCCDNRNGIKTNCEKCLAYQIGFVYKSLVCACVRVCVCFDHHVWIFWQTRKSCRCKFTVNYRCLYFSSRCTDHVHFCGASLLFTIQQYLFQFCPHISTNSFE